MFSSHLILLLLMIFPLQLHARVGLAQRSMRLKHRILISDKKKTATTVDSLEQLADGLHFHSASQVKKISITDYITNFGSSFNNV